MRRRIGLFALICLGVVTGGLVQLKLPENSPVGSIVSELRGSIDSSTPINAELEFRIVKSDRQNGLEIFEIEGNQGKLIVKQSPDREILCPGEEKCLLEVQVIQCTLHQPTKWRFQNGISEVQSLNYDLAEPYRR